MLLSIETFGEGEEREKGRRGGDQKRGRKELNVEKRERERREGGERGRREREDMCMYTKEEMETARRHWHTLLLLSAPSFHTFS